MKGLSELERARREEYKKQRDILRLGKTAKYEETNKYLFVLMVITFFVVLIFIININNQTVSKYQPYNVEFTEEGSWKHEYMTITLHGQSRKVHSPRCWCEKDRGKYKFDEDSY